jgi:hypothetical protein
MVDTAIKKGRAGTERPTSPDLRHVALWREDAERLTEEIVGNQTMDN